MRKVGIVAPKLNQEWDAFGQHALQKATALDQEWRTLFDLGKLKLWKRRNIMSEATETQMVDETATEADVPLGMERCPYYHQSNEVLYLQGGV